jgi:glutamate/tyrosine decarboxylase-like PLP-dependent enzyme
VIEVDVDNDARINVEDLKKKLIAYLKAERAVYAVVAIIGSTEHGACDPLDEIVKLREVRDPDNPNVSSPSVANHILFSS